MAMGESWTRCGSGVVGALDLEALAVHGGCQVCLNGWSMGVRWNQKALGHISSLMPDEGSHAGMGSTMARLPPMIL